MKSRIVPIKISHPSEIPPLEFEVKRAAGLTMASLCAAAADLEDPLQTLKAMKFKGVGFDPLHPERPLNLIEQVNQTFTYIVSFRAVEYLLRHRPDHAPFRLNLGARRGTDVESEDREVAAEVFAAVHPNSNNKLKKDILKVSATAARHRYVFFAVERVGRIKPWPGIEIIRVSLDGSHPPLHF